MDGNTPSDPYTPPKAELRRHGETPRRSFALSIVRAIATLGNVLLALMTFFALFAPPRTTGIADFVVVAVVVLFVSSSLAAIWLKNKPVAWVAVVFNGMVVLLLFIANSGNANPGGADQVANVVMGGLIAANLLTISVEVLIDKKRTARTDK